MARVPSLYSRLTLAVAINDWYLSCQTQEDTLQFLHFHTKLASPRLPDSSLCSCNAIVRSSWCQMDRSTTVSKRADQGDASM